MQVATLVAIGAVCGCSAYAAQRPTPPASVVTGQASPASVADLNGTDWRFVTVGGAAVPAGVTATLRFRAGHASGKAGCNAYGATYEIAADGTVGFNRSLATQMACLQPRGAMQVQRGVFAALRLARRAVLEHGKLVLLDAAGKPLARLATAAPPVRP